MTRRGRVSDELVTQSSSSTEGADPLLLAGVNDAQPLELPA